MQTLLSSWRGITPAARGILLMLLSTLGFSLMHGLVRYVSAEVHPVQIAFFRSFFGLAIFLPFILREGFVLFQTDRFPLHSLRGLLNFAAMYIFFIGLSLTPIANATALGFTAPVFAAVLSYFVLKERFRFRRWAAVICGFIGTLIILRPGFQTIQLGEILVVTSSLLWASTLMVIKILSRHENAITITAYMNVFLAALGLIPTLFVWQTPSLAAWGWLFVIAMLGTSAQLVLAQSLKEAEASLVMPFDFFKMVWAAALGWLLFAEFPDIFVWIGAALVVAATSYLAYRESRANKTVNRPNS